ncbi:unnamed protein product [Adineta steineri]|uniref:G-protein coupled receptors family 1 profile domain-containing protein n=1 Tax=Adineta steineri TaxID=433720 RepID=A0A813TN59_9BILA|nr:unnamed protein product [Adineta steineri]CAF3799671.1 unnamed protein product [Adineta steineri]
MANTSFDVVQKLNVATFWINQIYPLLQIIFGTFGNIFNIIIFTRRSLRNNPCSLYFIFGSINNCFAVDIALFARYLASTWNWDPSATNNVLCKLRNFFTYVSLTLSLWFTVLASIDRYLSCSKNARLRQMSNLTAARKNIIITTILICLFYSHILIYFKTGPSGTEISCIFSPYEYVIFLSFFGPIISCILPILLMSTFGILMILNVRNTHNRVGIHLNSTRYSRLRSHDRQLTIMLLFQVLITTLISVPYFVLAIYNAIAIVIFRNKLSVSQLAIYNFGYNLFRLLYYTNPVIAFYIYTISGTKFRVEMKLCIQNGFKCILKAIGQI